MKSLHAIFKWSDEYPALDIPDLAGVKRELARVAEARRDQPPVIATLEMHGYEVGVGLGSPDSFVHLEDLSGKNPYRITLGNADAEGVVAFFLHAKHHTEISRRNLIPISKALRVVADFFETGRPSPITRWQEV